MILEVKSQSLVPWPAMLIIVCGCLFLVYSCSDDMDPLPIAGSWHVDYWEVDGCLNDSLNFVRDLSSGDCIEEDSVIYCYDYVLHFNNEHEFVSNLKILEDSTFLTEVDVLGTYLIMGTNQIQICVPECDTLIYVREGRILNLISPVDSMSGCGQYIKATPL